MQKKSLLSFCLIYATLLLHAQDSILQRVIFIGNAGEINKEQEAVINSAVHQVIENKTTVIYLGNNISPNGFALNGGDKEEKSKKILHSQFLNFRKQGVPVYFIPGNNDWDNGNPKGLEKIKNQWSYLSSLQDSLLQLIPTNGCPDPVAINFSDSLVIIAFDSEWWLYQFNKNNPEADCNCKTKQEVADALEDLFYKNRFKVILLVSHHPFQSNGFYGGHFSLKDHLFPITTKKKHLYFPLPIIGSLYLFYKKIFTTSQDIGSRCTTPNFNKNRPH